MKKIIIAMIAGVALSCSYIKAEELARWGFNEGKGTESADLSDYKCWTLEMMALNKDKYSFPRELWGKEGDTPSGKGSALVLNGTDEYASLAIENGTANNYGKRQWTFGNQTTIVDFSISAWIKPAGGQHGIIIGHAPAGGYMGGAGWVWWYRKSGDKTDNSMFCYMVKVSDNEKQQIDQKSSSATGLNGEGKWTHWVMAYEADDGNGNAVICQYANGVLKSSDKMKKGTFNTDMSNQLNIGVSGQLHNSTKGGFFKGMLDELRIYDEALNQAQVELLYKMPDVDGAAVEALVNSETSSGRKIKKEKFLEQLKTRNGFRNVRNFGASGNGLEDDTLAIQAAINSKRGSAGAKKPAVVYVPPGRYRITNTIVIWDNTELVGDPFDPPTFFLPMNSEMFENPKLPKPFLVYLTGNNQAPGVLDWKMPESKQVSMTDEPTGSISNLIVKLEKGNPGAVGLVYRGQQKVPLHNVKVEDVDSAVGGFHMDLEDYLGPAPFITGWLACGPFDAPGPGDTGYNNAYIDEENVAPKPGDELGGKKWQTFKKEEITADGTCGYFADLGVKYVKNGKIPELVVAYLHTYVYAEDAVKCTFLFGVDDGYKIWVNGKFVEGLDRGGTAKADEFKVPVSLNKGWNRILVKVTQGSMNWKFAGRMGKTDGTLIKTPLRSSIIPAL